MKNTKFTHKDNEKQQKYTEPDKTLVGWFQKRLELERKFNKIKSKNSAGEKIDKGELQRERKSSNARKTEMLDKIIFPSLTNLIYFAETIEKNPELQNIFENDLKDLCDIRSRNANGMIDYYVDVTHYPSTRLISNNLVRLISSFLCLRKVDNHDLDDNFRNKLLHELNKVICAKSLKILHSKLHDYDVIYETAKETFSRSIGYTKLISEKYHLEKTEEKSPDKKNVERDENPKRTIFKPEPLVG